jgi:hypothetical protein
MSTRIWERGRQPVKGVGFKPSELIGGGRTPLLYNAVELLEEKFCRRFDRAASQKRVGRRRLATGADEPKL